MKSYAVSIQPKARKSLRKITKGDQVRIQGALELLSRNPYPPASRKLANSDYYRVRIGDYRILYSVIEEELIVFIIEIGHRREIYRKI